jgi:dienelactone hydrolase
MSYDRMHEDFDRRERRPRRSGGGRPVLLIIGGLAMLGLCCCGGLAWLIWYLIGPTSFPEQTQDYADARKQFRTTLTSHGRSPQPFNNDELRDGVKEIEYKSGDLELKAWIGGPKGGMRPAILFLHGGYALDNSDWDQCQPFRDAGFITMLPMLRGENGLKGDFTLFYDEVDDVVAAGEELARQPNVDPNRVFVAGHSAGGTLAMLAAMTTRQFRACASFSGSPDQAKFVKSSPEVALFADLVRFDKDNFQELVMRSPLAFPKSFKCPARLYWGDEEFAFRFSTQRLADRAHAVGLDVEAEEVPGDHMSAVHPAMEKAIEFFKQN